MTIQPDTHHATTTAHMGETPPDATAPIDGLASLRTQGDALAEIGAALGLTSAEIAAAESLDRLEIELARDLAWLTTLDEQHVTAWFAALGGDLALDLRLAGLDSQVPAPLAALRAGHDPAGTLARFTTDAQATAAAQGNELAVDVRLSLAKTHAIATAATLLDSRAEYFGTPEMRARTTVAVFYSSAACARLLSFFAILDWEQLGLARTDGRAFVVVCDRAGYLAGLALEIVGARDAEPIRWLEVSRAAWRQFQERAARARALHTEESLWAGAPRVLTPAHLRVEPRAAGLEPLAETLAATRAALAAAYLASSVHPAENSDLALRFAGARPATCRIPRRANADGDSAAPTAYAHHALARFAAWAYDNASADKLAIARECLARELPPGGSVSLAEIERAAAPALDAAKANFALYLRGNSDRYFTVRERALDAVSTYAAGVRKAVSDLTGDVVDNVYRTVGLLVGVVVAALLQPALALSVQRLAAFLYVAYLAFIVIFLLGAREQRFRLESAEVRAHLDAMPELGAAERAGLRVQAAGADAHFTRYLRLARLIYAVLALAGALYFLLLWTPLAPHLPLASPPTPTPPRA